jgi:hypothetical protein
LVRDGLQRTNHFIADTIYRELNLRRVLNVFSHHLFENHAAEPFARRLDYLGSAPFLPTENELAISVRFHTDQLICTRQGPLGAGLFRQREVLCSGHVECFTQVQAQVHDVNSRRTGLSFRQLVTQAFR